MFRRAQVAANEPVAGDIHGVRRAALVLSGRRVRRGAERVDADTAHDRQTVLGHPAGRQPVPRVPDGAPQPFAAQRFREADGRVHRPVRLYHGHQPPGGHGQVPELPKVRAGRGHRAGTVRHRYAGAVGLQQSPTAVRLRRQSAVRENVRSFFDRSQQIPRHTRRSGQQTGNNTCY